jgi:hypothetical protein
VEGLKQLFVDYAQGTALRRGRDPATRPVFLRLHGVAHGTFAVRPDLPADLRVGVFGQQPEFPVWVRFSGDIQPGSPDLKGTAGIGTKLFGVEGEKLLPPDQDATTHDFLLQNHDVFFVDTAKDMCEFFDPNGHGWHLDRSRFDATLRNAARDVGAEVLTATRLVGAVRDGAGWRVTLTSRNAGDELAWCDWLIDATGRRAAVARRVGAARLRDDVLVAIYARFRAAAGIDRAYRRHRDIYYAAEGRWPDRPFWHRRRGNSVNSETVIPGH